MAGNAEKPRLPTSVRLSKPLEDAVRISAAKSGRTLSGEIKVLIERALSAPRNDDALFGETPEEAAYNRAVGEAVALVRFQVGQWNDPRSEGIWQAGQYTNVAAAAAAVELLSRIPPDEGIDAKAIEDAQAVGRTTAQRLLQELKRSPRRPELAALAKALGISQEQSS